MSEIDNNVSENEQMPAPVKPTRKRRPRKINDQAADQNTEDAEKTVKRTRRRKTDAAAENTDQEQAEKAPVKRTRRKKTEEQADTEGSKPAEKPVRRTRRKKTEESAETSAVEAADAEQAAVRKPRRRRSAETETDAVKKPPVRRIRRKKTEAVEEAVPDSEPAVPAEAEQLNETEPSAAENGAVLAFGMPETVNAEPVREMPGEGEELPSRYETPEYQAFLKTQFPEENPVMDIVPGEEQSERTVPEEPADTEAVPEEVPAEENRQTAEPEVIPFTAEPVSEENIPERAMPEAASVPAEEKSKETAEESTEPETFEETAEEPVITAEEQPEAEPEVIPITAEAVPEENIPERAMPEETEKQEEKEEASEENTEPEAPEAADEEPVITAEEEPETETPAEAEPEKTVEETEESTEPEVPGETAEEPAVPADVQPEEKTAEPEPVPDEPERTVSEEGEELPSRYDTPEYQAFLKEQEKEDQPAETEINAEEGIERTVPEETAEAGQDIPKQAEEGNEELPSRYDTPEYQAFLKEQEKEEIPFTDSEFPPEESGERSVPEGSEEKDPGPRRKRIAEQNRRKKKKSKKKEKYVSKLERGIVEEKPVPVQEPETETPAEVREEPEVIPFVIPKNEEPEEIPFVNPRDEEQQAEAIPFLSELKPEEPAEGEAERTRSISLSSIEAEASEPIPEPSVSFEELKYKRNPLIKRISDPNGCMANVTEQTSRSAMSILMGLLLKWGFSCVMYVAYVANVLNKDAFSYARMVFTDASWLWFRLVMICIAAELITLLPAKLICRGNRKAGAGKIMTVMLEADFSPLLFMAGGALLFVNTAAGIAVTAVAAGYELLMRVKALEIATECRKIPALIASLLFFCVLAALGYYGLKYLGGDLIKIYSVISGK
ncbi:MAG: hypothetical protein IJI75_10590 [Solobacterium sp.]|nr:hypothetical protein [Solobacterium sp.]